MRVFAISISEKKKIIRRWLLFFLAGIILNFIWIIFAPYGLIRIYLINKESKRLQEIKLKKEEELRALEVTIRRIENLEDIDDIIREELRLFKKNEIIFLFEEKKTN